MPGKPTYEELGQRVLELEKVVSKRKQTEHALRESESLLSSVFRAAPTGIGVVSNRILLAVNDRVCEMIGYSREEMIGQSARMLYPSDAQFENVGTEKYRQILQFGTGTVETQWRCKDGRIIDILMSSTPINLLDLSEGVTFTALDITERKKAEAALRESEERFRKLFQKHSAVKLIIDPDTWNIIDANDAALSFYGWSIEEIRRMRIQQISLLPPEEVNAEMKKIVSQGSAKIEIRQRRADGSIRDVEMYCNKIDIAGKGLIYSVVHDTTERKHVEDLLKDEISRWRILFENSRDGIVVLDQNGKVYEANKRYADMLGYSMEEINQLHVWDWDTQFSKEQIKEMLRSIDDAGAHFETRQRRKDGTIINVELSNSGAVYKEHKLIFCICRDITERKQIADSFRQSEEKFRLVFENALDGILFTSPDGGIYAANPAACQILGCSEQEICEGGRDIVVDVTDLRLPQALKERTLTGRFRGELSFRRRDGTTFPAEASSSTFLLISGEQRAYITFRDITRRKQAAAEKAKLENMNQQLQKAESLNRMAGAVSHHFNNQLQVVMGNLEMTMGELQRGENPIAAMNEAMHAALKAADVSRLMLTYLGQTPGKHEPLDLSEACRQSLTLLQAAVPQGVIFKTDFPASGPVILADANQILQVLANLATNAWEATEENRRDIGLTVKTVSQTDIPVFKRFPADWEPQESIYACLEVADAGSGIVCEDIDKIFDPFYTTKFTGRGMGLSVVLGIVKAHNGGITVESKPDRGSIFRIFLPLSAEVVHRQPDKPTQFPEIQEGGKVLLIEDEEQVRKMAKIMLSRLGYVVLEAKDGVEALEIFQKHQHEIRCVLSDLTMPNMNGWETLAALRKLSPGIPVILSSGYDEAQVMAGEHHERPSAFLGKPYQLKGLRETISRVLTDQK